MLVLDIGVGEWVAVGQGVQMSLVKKSGQRARIKFRADPSVPINIISSAGSQPADHLRTKYEEAVADR